MVGFSFTKVPFIAITQQVRFAKSLSSWERMHLSLPSLTMEYAKVSLRSAEAISPFSIAVTQASAETWTSSTSLE